MKGEGIVALISFLLCAVPFAVIACFGKDSMTPLSFWAGDKSLADKVTNVPEYNAKMAKLYGRCAAAFAITGLLGLFSVVLSILLLAAECTVGFYCVYKAYKKILNVYSDSK